MLSILPTYCHFEFATHGLVAGFPFRRPSKRSPPTVAVRATRHRHGSQTSPSRLESPIHFHPGSHPRPIQAHPKGVWMGILGAATMPAV